MSERDGHLETSLVNDKDLGGGTELDSIPGMVQLEKTVAKAVFELKRLRERNLELSAKNRVLADDVGGMKKELSEKSDEINSLKESIRLLSEQKETLQARKDEIARRLEQLIEKFEWLVER